jgi:hypothetical protein
VSFLSITFLVALPLALAPILLHLFDRRRNVTIEWGAMEFLVDAATRRTSARKLKQWLLLALRVLAIAALIFALARPKLPGHWFGSSDRGETIFVIDNSMSTLRKSGETTIFAQLIEKANVELNDVPSGDSVRVLLSSPYPVWATAGEIRVESGSREMIAEQFQQTRPTNGSSDLLAAMLTAVQADTESDSQKRKIVLLTDGQASDWKTNDSNGWHRFQDALKSATLPTELDVIELGKVDTKKTNLAVNTVQSSRLVTGVGQSFTLTAQIQNHSDVESAGCGLVWETGSTELHTEDVPSLIGGNTHEAVWRHAFSKPGVYSLTCRINADDCLEPDNHATVVVEVIEEVPVLVVDGAMGQAELQQDAFFLQAAMGWINGEALESHSVYRPVTVGPDDLEQINLAEFRAVIIPNFTAITEAAIQRLKAYATNGGGVWIALGPRTEIEMFNQHVFAHGDGLSPLAIDGIVAEANAQSSPRLDAAQKDHPATRSLSDGRKLDTNDVRVRRRFRFVPPPRNEDVAALLSLTNGETLAVEKSMGRGRIIVLGIPLTMRDWSELAKSQAFVVMVQDWVSYLTQPQATQHNLMPGDPIAVQLPDTEHQEAFLKTPHGDQVVLTADAVSDGVVFRSNRTILPGDYVLQMGLSGDTIPFHVQRNSRESNLAALTDDDHKLLAQTAGLSTGMMDAGLRGSSQSDPVWPFLLMLLIAFMSTELILAGMISRERFGTAAVAETTERLGDMGMGSPIEFGQKMNVSERIGASRR